MILSAQNKSLADGVEIGRGDRRQHPCRAACGRRFRRRPALRSLIAPRPPRPAVTIPTYRVSGATVARAVRPTAWNAATPAGVESIRGAPIGGGLRNEGQGNGTTTNDGDWDRADRGAGCGRVPAGRERARGGAERAAHSRHADGHRLRRDRRAARRRQHRDRGLLAGGHRDGGAERRARRRWNWCGPRSPRRGVADEDLQTVRISLDEEFNYTEEGRVSIGFTFRNTIRVTVDGVDGNRRRDRRGRWRRWRHGVDQPHPVPGQQPGSSSRMPRGSPPSTRRAARRSPWPSEPT